MHYINTNKYSNDYNYIITSRLSSFESLKGRLPETKTVLLVHIGYVLTSRICRNETCRNSLIRTVRYIVNVNVTQALRRESSPHHTTPQQTPPSLERSHISHSTSCLAIERQFMVNGQQASPKSSHVTQITQQSLCVTTLRGVRWHSDKHAPRNFPEAQCAFKVLMILEVLQFALRIAFRCVLHRCGNLDIHRWKLCVIQLVQRNALALSQFKVK